MCRLLSIAGKPKDITAKELLGKFKRLAEFGNVPPKTPKGHKDGWGLVFYAKNKPPRLFRAIKDAYASAGYNTAAKKISTTKHSVLIGHLRKSSVGAKRLANTQPFMKRGYAFAHNGTIFDSKKITLKSFGKNFLKGDTDSERFFALILQNLFYSKKKDLQQALLSAVALAQKSFNYTALNLILSDGKDIFALREINADTKDKRLLNYYSLFVG
ncbi:MAG: class II glutamine amidotransferase, partial [Candidatus Komeilibacteria bacterium]|nr:class II glutamine amidotransferase [Candidatus Komeilibacteria bacterium]